MFRKRIFFVLAMVFILVINLLPTSIADTSSPPDVKSFLRGSEVSFDNSNEDSTFDTAAKINEGSQKKTEFTDNETLICYNQETGVATAMDSFSVFYDTAKSLGTVLQTEPYIPEGLTLAEPFDNHTVGVDMIIGKDDRAQITNVNTFPYCAIVHLEVIYVNAPNSVYNISGVMVAKNLVLTAGHNVYDPTLGWAKSVKVKPGGINSTYTSTTSTDVYSVSGWTNSNNSEYDYGIIKLSSNIGANTGYYGTKVLSDSNLKNKNIYSYGYPADKAKGTLWYSSGSITSVYTRILAFDADAIGGMSGGPIVIASDHQYVVGINTYASTSINCGTRIISAIVSYINGF